MAPKSTAPESSSLRLLVLSPSPPDATSIPPFRSFLEKLTGTKPADEVTSFAGYTSHPPLRLRTKYYHADVSIWCDELPIPSASKPSEIFSETSIHGGSERAKTGKDAGAESQTPTLEEWKDQMLSLEASEVRAVIGGIILLLPTSSTQVSPISPLPEPHLTLIETAHLLREAIENDSYGRDIASVVVLQATSQVVGKDEAKLKAMMERLEEECLGEKGILGWDYVAWDGRCSDQEMVVATSSEDVLGKDSDARNEYGEKTGFNRLVEVLEGVDWSASPVTGNDEDGDGDVDREDVDLGNADGMSNSLGNGRFSGLDFELQREMMELKISMLEDDRDVGEKIPGEPKNMDENVDLQIEQLPGLIERVVAIREAGLELPNAERKEFARREIRRIMKEMG